MKFIQLPRIEFETIELTYDMRGPFARMWRAPYPEEVYTTKIPGRATFTTGMLKLEKGDDDWVIGYKRPGPVVDEESGFVMHGVLPFQKTEDGVVSFMVDWMVHKSSDLARIP